MVGNAVPPTLAFHLAKEIMEILKEKIEEKAS
ncbi:DNA cytosine methyltransferase [Aliarcobacter butzleri]|nr:DNA cytosine methyltransferase [Aliarcobacter butzleri]MCT7548642.1 DNA cytosine methyltransferase [Aliarcobacter butzleri]